MPTRTTACRAALAAALLAPTAPRARYATGREGNPGVLADWVRQNVKSVSYGKSRTADLTSELILRDAGTEVNDEPGLGAHPAPRQTAPGAGSRERRPVQRASAVRDGFRYPVNAQVLRVTLRPAAAAATQ